MIFFDRTRRIGLNLLYINPKLLGGSFIYAKSLIEEIAKIDKINNYVIYINKECKNLQFNIGSNFKIRILNFNYSNVYLRYFWEQFVLPFYLYRDRIELIHSLGYVTPILTPVKKVVSILDINYRGHSLNMRMSKRILLGIMVNLSAVVSKSIITISEFSKKEIVKHTPAKFKKINVTLLSGSFDEKNELKITKETIKSKYSIDSNYIICFSSSSPHKNIVGLIDAIENILHQNLNIKLLLVGHLYDSIKIAIKKYKLEDKIICTGFVPAEDIKPLISYADVFIFPSLYEGFGVPLLDAQSCGTLIVSSNAGSLPEIAGSNVYYFDPKNKKDMQKKILEILSLNNKIEIDNLINCGYNNRKKYSWSKTAFETIKVYEKMFD